MIYTYLFYSIYNGYKNFGEKQIPGLYAVGIITLLQWLPIFSIVTICFKLKLTSFNLYNKEVVVISILLFLVANSIAFLPKKNKEKAILRIQGLSKRKLKIIQTISIIYSIIAFALVVTILTM